MIDDEARAIEDVLDDRWRARRARQRAWDRRRGKIPRYRVAPSLVAMVEQIRAAEVAANA